MPKLTAELVYLMREASGMGMMECKDAAVYAIDKLNGDFALALLMRSANGYAVMIKSRDPKVTNKQARDRWNLGHALGLREDIAETSDAWRRLVERSGKWDGAITSI